MRPSISLLCCLSMRLVMSDEFYMRMNELFCKNRLVFFMSVKEVFVRFISMNEMTIIEQITEWYSGTAEFRSYENLTTIKTRLSLLCCFYNCLLKLGNLLFDFVITLIDVTACMVFCSEYEIWKRDKRGFIQSHNWIILTIKLSPVLW